jgi:hypothetical protein
MPVGNRLRVQSLADATVRWSVNDGAARETASRDTTLGAWIADLETERLPVGAKIRLAAIPAVTGGWNEIHEVIVVV